MDYDQVIQTIKNRFPDAIEGDTTNNCPDDLNWVECQGRLHGYPLCANGGGHPAHPWVFKAGGPRGGGHALGIALQVNSIIISYGRVGAGSATCCAWCP